MKLTEQHVSDEWIDKRIAMHSEMLKREWPQSAERLHRNELNAYLELKQRRYEDRQREELGRLGHFHKVDENGL